MAEVITYKIQIDSGDEIDVGEATSYDITALDLGSHTIKITGTCNHGTVKPAQKTFNVALKANTLLIEIEDSDEARTWVESTFDTTETSTRSYVKKNNTQYYVTENEKDWYHLFYNCTYLTKVIDGNTGSVEAMSGMFDGCAALSSVTMPNTGSVKDMTGAFTNCKSLTAVPNLNINNVIKVSSMFSGCTNIQSGMLDFYETASTKSVTVTSFTDCFTICGTQGGNAALAERAHIPTSWGGDGAEMTITATPAVNEFTATISYEIANGDYDTWTVTCEGQTATGTTGSFEFTDLAPGTYTYAVTAKCAHNIEITTDVTFTIEEPHKNFDIVIDEYTAGDTDITWTAEIES